MTLATLATGPILTSDSLCFPEACIAENSPEPKYRRGRPMTQISASFCHSGSVESSPDTDALPLYVLIEEASGLYFVDGDEPRVSVTVECNEKKVKIAKIKPCA